MREIEELRELVRNLKERASRANEIDILIQKISVFEERLKKSEERIGKSDERFAALEKSLEKFSERYGEIEKTLEEIAKLKEGFENMKVSINKLATDSKRIDKLEESVRKFPLQEIEEDVSKRMNEIKDVLDIQRSKIEELAGKVGLLEGLEERIKKEVSAEVKKRIGIRERKINEIYKNFSIKSQELDKVKKMFIERVDELGNALAEKIDKINVSFATFKEELESLKKRVIVVERIKRDVNEIGAASVKQMGLIENLSKEVSKIKGAPEKLAMRIVAREMRRIGKIEKDLSSKVDEVMKIREELVSRLDEITNLLERRIARINEKFSSFSMRFKKDMKKRFFAEVGKITSKFDLIRAENEKYVQKFLERMEGEFRERIKKYFSSEHLSLLKTVERFITKRLNKLDKKISFTSKSITAQIQDLVAEYEKRFNILREEIEKSSLEKSESVRVQLHKVLVQQEEEIKKIGEGVNKLEKGYAKISSEVNALKENLKESRTTLLKQLGDLVAEYEKRFETIRKRLASK